MAQIDLSNYATTLVQSTAGRAGSPDGNVYFDKTTGKLELLDVTEVPTVDLTAVGGGATDPNPLQTIDGIKFEAIYAFENQERKIDEVLGQYDRWTSGTFKFGGAYNFVNARVPADVVDIALIRGSGWNEYDGSNVVQKIYFGNKGLSNIELLSQPYYQLGWHTTATDYQKAGQFDEAILVYENGVADNKLTDEYVSIRTYGQNYDRKSTAADLGIAELGGYSTGFAVNENIHLTTSEGTMPIASVYNTDPSSQVGAWLNMTLEELDTPRSVDGFTQGDGKEFTWVLNNPQSTSLNNCVAYLDAIATQAEDVNAHGTNTDIGKDVDVWYTYNAAGKVVTQNGSDIGVLGEGVFIENVPPEDKQSIVFIDDTNTLLTYPAYTGITANLGNTISDVEAWFQTYFATSTNGNYNTPTAVTVEDKNDSAVKSVVGVAISLSPFYVSTPDRIVFEFDYLTGGGSGDASADQDCVFVVEGDGTVTQAKTLYTITDTPSISITCAPLAENNV